VFLVVVILFLVFLYTSFVGSSYWKSGVRQAKQRNRKKQIMKKRIRGESFPRYRGKEDEFSSVFEYDKFRSYGNKGGGDCLFHAVKQLLKFLNKNVSVLELRSIVANSVTEEQYQFLKQIVKHADRSVRGKYGFVLGSENLDEMRRNMLKSSYYGDELAVRAFSEYLGVKLLVLSLDDQTNRVFLANDLDSQEWPYFAFLKLQHVHYELVSYDKKVVFKRSHLPDYVVKKLNEYYKVSKKMV
jgi:hypothetical protein